MLKMFKENCSK
ncbi:UNVERIFIED_CONTAM: hypothetical protein GTU68_065781 [Idotea baltica]|nr:hypothetical protein [Idotea baltica]